MRSHCRCIWVELTHFLGSSVAIRLTQKLIGSQWLPSNYTREGERSTAPFEKRFSKPLLFLCYIHGLLWFLLTTLPSDSTCDLRLSAWLRSHNVPTMCVESARDSEGQTLRCVQHWFRLFVCIYFSKLTFDSWAVQFFGVKKCFWYFKLWCFKCE